jgi:hypothetical protein
MQLDLFTHSRDVMLQNDVIAALRERDVVKAQQALVVLTAEFPTHEIVGPMTMLLNTLTTPVERFTDHQAVTARLHAMDTLVVHAASRVFGNTEAGGWLAPLWQSLADAATGLPFNAKAPHTHAAYMQLQGGDWAAAEAAIAGIPSWRRIPAPLAWMAEARFVRGGLEHAWCLLMELAWIDADTFGVLVGRLRAPSLHKLLHDFDVTFDEDGQPDRAWFPAWLLITAPAMALVMRETQTSTKNTPERVARLVMELLALEKQGRHNDLVAQRRKLRDLHAGLYATYMASR